MDFMAIIIFRVFIYLLKYMEPDFVYETLKELKCDPEILAENIIVTHMPSNRPTLSYTLCP